MSTYDEVRVSYRKKITQTTYRTYGRNLFSSTAEIIYQIPGAAHAVSEICDT